MKKLLSILMCLVITLTAAGMFPIESMAAPDWPQGPAVTAEGACLIDANTGTILYSKNMDEPFFPASITKIMTALIVIETTPLDEIVTFSRDAVFNVEPGSSSLGMDVGDQLSVEDCLYGLLLKSANEVGNALAEHVAGSVEEFAKMMNERARELGCTNTNFVNPHGLNNPDHKVSSHDMALIAAAAFSNETFVRIDSTRSYHVPPTKRNPDGIYVSCGHRMLKKNDAMYYPGIIGGKTGYTSLAGNTLVTCVERNGLKLVSVVMKDTNPSHYEDTRNLLDFGFANFQAVNVSQNDTSYSFIDDDFTFNGLPATENQPPIELNKQAVITLPIGATLADTTSELTYDLPEGHAPQSIAQISYTYLDKAVGTATLDFTAPARQTFQFAPAAEPGQETGPDGEPQGGQEPAPAALDGQQQSPAAQTGQDASQPASDGALEGQSDGETLGTGTSANAAKPSSGTPAQNTDGNSKTMNLVFRILGILAIVAFAAAGVVLLGHYSSEHKRRLRRARRMTRLSDLPPSTTLEFDKMLKERMKKDRKNK